MARKRYKPEESRGAYAIRALPDLCLGASGGLAHFPSRQLVGSPT